MNKEEIEQLLRSAGLDPSIFDTDGATKLSGGVVSVIIALGLAKSDERFSQHNVLKHTKTGIPTAPPFSYPDEKSVLEPAPETHHLDTTLLRFLASLPEISVPQVCFYSQEARLTIMKDFRSEGFRLMQDLLVEGNLPEQSAVMTGKMLAHVVLALKDATESGIRAVEDPVLQVRERLEELHNFLRFDLHKYQAIEKKFLSGAHLIPTDGHPKNIAVDPENPDEVMVFDFGRSIVGDPQFVAPNFAAHIGLAVLGGSIEMDKGLSYIRQFIFSFNEVATDDYAISEEWFITYFMSELLHRGLSGRWIDKRIYGQHSQQEVQQVVQALAIDVFNPSEPGLNISTIESLLERLQKYTLLLQRGFYKQTLDERLAATEPSVK